MPKKVVTPRLRTEVRALRGEGWSWPEIAEITGISQRTVIRAYRPPSPKSCAQRGCHEPANPHGRFCVEHSKRLMGGVTGRGPRQTEVLRIIRKHGFVSAEQLRDETGLDSMNLGQVTGNLLKLGLIDRPVRGYYRLPPANLAREK